MDYIWGDNQSMINGSTIPDAKLHKRHIILSFHNARSMVSRGYINTNMLRSASKYNFSGILTKHWGFLTTYYELIQPVLHHKGYTTVLFFNDILEVGVEG